MADKNLTFEEQQAYAYAFLDVFYNRADFGYDVSRWRKEDVNQNIIDTVNQMGEDIYTNTRVVTIASEVFQKMAARLAGGGVGFITALSAEVITGDFGNSEDILFASKEQLMREKERYRGNNLAWAVITQVMANNKNHIEMAFLGFV